MTDDYIIRIHDTEHCPHRREWRDYTTDEHAFWECRGVPEYKDQINSRCVCVGLGNPGCIIQEKIGECQK
jgi:hypothetical protein